MIQNPDVQQRMREEILDIVGIERRISYKDRPFLPFSEATIHETLRLGNISPYALPHLASDDIFCKDFIIPKGAVIIPCLDSLNNDPDIFNMPERFDPFRFLDYKDNIVFGTNRSMPFSTGKQ